MDEYVVVGAYSSEMEADLVVQRLVGVGIQAATRSDNVGGMFPSMEMATGGVEVLVPAGRLSDARRALIQVTPAPSPRKRRRVPRQSQTDQTRPRRRFVTVGILVVLILILLATMLNFLESPLP